MNRKRIFCMILSLALLAPILALPASGAADLAFIAVNDAIPQTLSGGELPFYSDGLLYVPYTVFNASSLGFYPSYTPENKTLTLFNRSKRLVFDLSAGIVTDETQVIDYTGAISRNGTIFLPAVFCASHFGVGVSELTSQGGYTVVRFTTGSQIYDDSLFIEKAENLISYRVSQYLDSLKPDVQPEQPEQPVTPTTPTTPSQTEDSEQDEAPAEIYLAIVGADTMDQALTQLHGTGYPAVFFLTAEEIAADPDLVRRIVSEGYSVGLTTSLKDSIATELQLANEALDRALRRKTLLALVPEDADLTSLSTQYCLVTYPTVRLTATQAVRAHGESRVLICDGPLLEDALPILEEADVTFSLLTETTQIPA